MNDAVIIPFPTRYVFTDDFPDETHHVVCEACKATLCGAADRGSASTDPETECSVCTLIDVETGECPSCRHHL